MKQTPEDSPEDSKAKDAPSWTCVFARLDVDLGKSLRFTRFGPLDPTSNLGSHSFARAFYFQDAPTTLLLRWNHEKVRADAWISADAKGMAERTAGLNDLMPGLLGHRDLVPSQSPHSHPLVDSLWQKHRHIRLPRVPWIFHFTIDMILQQKVAFVDAAQTYRSLVRFFGNRAPGPLGLLLPPSAHELQTLPTFEAMGMGIDAKRTGRMRNAALNYLDIQSTLELPLAEAEDVLSQVPGLGPWTRAHILGQGLGNPDALPLKDYWLPHDVVFALAGLERSDDERMEKELLPFAGQRYRVIRLIMESELRAPRKGPRANFGKHTRIW